MPGEVERRGVQPPSQTGDAGVEHAAGPTQAPADLLAQVERFFAGPLPPPQVLEAYNAIIPGAAKEMHDLVIAKARHDMEIERDAMGAQAQDQQAARAQFKRGQYLTFLLALAVIGWGGTCVLKGHDWAGATFTVGTLAALVLAFLWGRRSTGPRQQQSDGETPTNSPQS